MNPKLRLTSNTKVSPTTIKLGKEFTVTYDAMYGTGDISYNIYYKLQSEDMWTNIQEFPGTNTDTIKPEKEGIYDVLVAANDSEGNKATKTFTVTVTKDLTNDSTVVNDTIVLGSSIDVKATASGGTENYTYAVYYKQAAQNTWTCAQSYSQNTDVRITPKAATTYDVRVKVKDTSGKIVNKDFTVNVVKKLTNTSTVSAESITLGQTVTVNASAVGGAGDYTYAVYYKKSSSNSWTLKQNYDKNSTITIKPAARTDYDICIKVKDSSGTVQKIYKTLTVK